MTQTPELDIPASIKRLAEATGPCSGAFLRDTLGRKIHDWDCPVCAGTGRSALFPSLRVECGGCASNAFVNYGVLYVPESCPGWHPEPDVRVACWEVWVTMCSEEDSLTLSESGGMWGVANLATKEQLSAECPTAKEAVLRAAEAWLEEKP